MKKDNSLRASQKKKKDLIFYCCLLAYPIASFCVFYIAINANSILLAFKEKKDLTSGFTFLEFNNIFVNFKTVLVAFFGDAAHMDARVSNIFSNSFKAFASQIFIALPLGILFSYYIFKKSLCSGAFKVILFLPSIISSVVMCYIFSNMVGDCYKSIAEKFFNAEVQGLLDNPDTRFKTLIFYQLWVGFGTTILLFSGAMSGINESILEAGKVDGVTSLREFFSIVFPLSFPTLIVFVTMQLANLFLNQINIYPFFGQDNEDYGIYTMGYYLFHETIRARGSNGFNYPTISALGVLLTLFIAPITICINFLMKKFGPSAD